MKVAFISYDFGEYCIRIASALCPGATVGLILPHQLAAGHLGQLGEAVQFRPFFKPRLRHPLKQISTGISIVRWIKKFSPDVIHMQQGHLWFNLFLPCLKRYPLVITIHDPKHHVGDKESRLTPQWSYDFGFRKAQHLIVHATAMAQAVIHSLGITEEKIHIIPHIQLGEEMYSEPVEEGDPQILFFGRIWAYKGLEYLIRAEPIILDEVPNAKIVIAGQGDDFERYRKLMKNEGNFVIRNEYVSDRIRAELFRRSSVVVLPYIEATQSGVIPLAYSCAKPVIATTVGGLPEMVDHGQTGFLVPPGDVKELANAIIRILKDKELGRRLGQNAKNKIERECSSVKVAEMTMEVYRQAAKGRDSMDCNHRLRVRKAWKPVSRQH